jgi:hypothetical protein
MDERDVERKRDHRRRQHVEPVADDEHGIGRHARIERPGASAIVAIAAAAFSPLAPPRSAPPQ